MRGGRRRDGVEVYLAYVQALGMWRSAINLCTPSLTAKSWDSLFQRRGLVLEVQRTIHQRTIETVNNSPWHILKVSVKVIGMSYKARQLIGLSPVSKDPSFVQ